MACTVLNKNCYIGAREGRRLREVFPTVLVEAWTSRSCLAVCMARLGYANAVERSAPATALRACAKTPPTAGAARAGIIDRLFE